MSKLLIKNGYVVTAVDDYVADVLIQDDKVESFAPAQMSGLFPRKDTIALGSDGDVVLFDPNKQHMLSVWQSAVALGVFHGVALSWCG